MFLFWIETAIIGFYSGLKAIKAFGIFTIFLAPFFMLHFGGFMFGHLAFIYALFGGDQTYSGLIPSSSLLYESVNGLIFPIFLLFVSHGISFYVNYIRGGEYLLVRNSKQSVSPYGRVMLMHMVIIFGAWIIMGLHTPIGALLLLVIGKIIFDVSLHIRTHKKISEASREGVSRINPLALVTTALANIAKQRK
jgi:hypothetical protein